MLLRRGVAVGKAGGTKLLEEDILLWVRHISGEERDAGERAVN